MKIQYLNEEQLTIAELAALTGLTVVGLVVGNIEVGVETVEDEGNPGQTIEQPVTKRGIEIEFEDRTLPAAALELLDTKMISRRLKRRT